MASPSYKRRLRDGILTTTNKKRRGAGLPVVTGLNDVQMISFLAYG
jgi:hypothetical protein